LDFLDKALEKAKALRQKTEEARSTSAGKTPAHQVPPPMSAPGMPLGEINYIYTRTVPVEAEWLHKQRILAGAEDPVGEAYKLLRTQILQRTRADNKNLLMITGPQVGEGKTLTAINLAISLSQEVDKTVLLVDADLRRPTVHEYFGLPPGPGLVDYLTGGHALSDILVHPEGFSKFVILPGGRPVAEAAELISSPMMAELVEELKHFYADRYVLFDLPPLLAFADALAFAPLMDGIILVVEKGQTTREDLQRCLELLKDFPLLGTVLNKVDLGKPGYYYPEYSTNHERPAGGKSWWAWLRS
jgi:protein-tyrosine kinase